MEKHPTHSTLGDGFTNPSEDQSTTGIPAYDDLDFGQTIRGFRDGQKVFGRFTLKRILGRGGMGVVWLGWDERLEEEVALKFMPEMVRLDDVAIKDLTREARKSRRLTHSHIVRIHDFFEDETTAAIVMEFVDGWTLSTLRLHQPGEIFSPEQLQDWLRQLGDALGYAHETGRLVHRDLKPSNLMVTKDGRLKITDFGIASSITDSVSRLSMRAGNSGSPPYMSPQQLLGESPQVTDDIYSLGATIYELLTGKPPFYRGNIPRQVETVVPPPMTERRTELGGTGQPIPAIWESLIAACLAKDPSGRPQTVGELLALLDGTAKGGLAGSKGKPGLARIPLKILLPLLSVGLAACVAGGWYFAKVLPEKARAQEIADAQKAKADADALEKSLREEKERQAELQRAEVARLAAEQAAKAPGMLTLITEPPGAQITLDGVASGTSPAILRDLAVGSHTISVALPGYDSLEKKVTIAAGDITDPGKITLRRSVGTATITSEPEGQDFELHLVNSPVNADPKVVRTGATPATFTDLPTGTYSAIISRPGWPQQTREFSLAANQSTQVKAEFPETAKLAPPPVETIFTIDELFQGTPYARYNHFSRARILRIAQEKLKNSGLYTGTADGVAGRGTQTAIVAWQSQEGLSPNGKLDQATQESLGLGGLDETNPPPTPTPRKERPAQKPSRPASTPAPTPVPTPEPKKDITVEEFMQKARELRQQ